MQVARAVPPLPPSQNQEDPGGLAGTLLALFVCLALLLPVLPLQPSDAPTNTAEIDEMGGATLQSSNS